MFLFPDLRIEHRARLREFIFGVFKPPDTTRKTPPPMGENSKNK